MLAQGEAPKAKRRCATLGKQRQDLVSALPKAGAQRSGALQNKGTLLTIQPPLYSCRQAQLRALAPACCRQLAEADHQQLAASANCQTDDPMTR
jgi:hypothetical protein